jgi:hypothetical protein
MKRLHVNDRVRNGPDGVVVEEESLQKEIVGALLRKLS